MNSGLNTYIITEEKQSIIQQLENHGVVIVNQQEECEYLDVNDVVVVVQNEILAVECAKKWQLFYVIENEQDIIEQEYYVIDLKSKQQQNSILKFNTKEELFLHLEPMDYKEFCFFISEEKANIIEITTINNYLKNKVDLKLIKIKLVNLWKY